MKEKIFEIICLGIGLIRTDIELIKMDLYIRYNVWM